MPTRASRICTTPGCPNLQTGASKCDPCRNRRHAATNARRPTPAQQGYDKHWQRTSIRYRQQHPACECTLPHCHGDGPCTAPSEHTDHIDGRKPTDPGGHDPRWLAALCTSCHSTKTARHDGGFGRVGGNH